MLALMLFLLLFPIYWMINTSFKEVGEVRSLPQTYFPKTFTLQNYVELFERWRFGSTFINTAIIAGLSALGGTALGAMAAFGFNRFDFPGKGLFFGFMIVSIALPGMVTIGPVFMAYKNLGLLDTKTGLILIDLSAALPFAIIFLYAFYQSIPRELDDAARIDGCTWVQTLWFIILPLSAPGVVITYIISFIGGWNEFVFANVLTMSESTRVLTVRMMEIPTIHGTPYNLMAVGGMLCLFPIAIIVVIGQRQIVEGLISGSLKG
jgi:ABC-type glycerol-3-phosphate transport system permease component